MISFSYATTLSLMEWLAVTGLAQSVLILVYIILRVRSWRQAALTICYFLALAAAFGLQFALRLDDYTAEIRFALWCVWMLGPPLCALLVVQMSRQADMPLAGYFHTLLFMPLALVLALVAERSFNICASGFLCPRFFDWLYWLGAMAGALALLSLWGRDNILSGLRNAKGGKERYWLAIALVAINVLVVAVFFVRSSGGVSDDSAGAVLVTSGIAFLYLAGTALFRVYPQPVQLNAVSRLEARKLTAEEMLLGERIRKLMEVDKVYQEPSFSRASLARELNVSEGTVSRVLNVTFGKSFRALLNDFRVGDAKIMLRDPAIPVKTVAFEAGFNSLASFNRVFREITGETPSSYRDSQGRGI